MTIRKQILTTSIANMTIRKNDNHHKTLWTNDCALHPVSNVSPLGLLSHPTTYCVYFSSRGHLCFFGGQHVVIARPNDERTKKKHVHASAMLRSTRARFGPIFWFWQPPYRFCPPLFIHLPELWRNCMLRQERGPCSRGPGGPRKAQGIRKRLEMSASTAWP